MLHALWWAGLLSSVVSKLAELQVQPCSSIPARCLMGARGEHVHASSPTPGAPPRKPTGCHQALSPTAADSLQMGLRGGDRSLQGSSGAAWKDSGHGPKPYLERLSRPWDSGLRTEVATRFLPGQPNTRQGWGTVLFTHPQLLKKSTNTLDQHLVTWKGTCPLLRSPLNDC